MASLREVGQRLRQAREAQQLSLEDVAARTRITVRHLLALEEGNETDLPETFYIRGFLKKYAETVGLAPNEVADAYKAAPTPVVPQADLRPSFGPIVYYMAIIGLLGGAAALAWHFQPRVSVVDDSSPSPSPSVLVTAGPSSAPTEAPSATPLPAAASAALPATSPEPTAALTASPMPAATPAQPATTPSSNASAVPPAASPKPTPSAKPTKKPTPSPKPTPKPTAKPTPKPSPTPKPTATPAPSATPAPVVDPTSRPTEAAMVPATLAPTTAPTAQPSPRPSAKPSPAKNARTQVSLTFVERSWVEVRVDGRLVFEGIFNRGVSRKFSGKTIEVAAGNSGGIRINKDGKDLGRLGRHAEVAVRTYKP